MTKFKDQRSKFKVQGEDGSVTGWKDGKQALRGRH
jgi:hypothetical protein